VLRVSQVNPGLGVVADPETGDDAASATPVSLTMGAGLVIGDFADMTDVDVYSVALGGTATVVYGSALAPAGPMGYGSTSSAGHVWITSAEGTEILARINHSAGPFQLAPPLAGGKTYLVWIEHPPTVPIGTNDFYVHKVITHGDNPPELETAAGQNDTVATAEPLTATMGSSFVLAQLTTTTDVDTFQFTAPAGEKISIACAGSRVGSGVVGLRAELRDGTDTLLVGKTESLTADLFIDSVTASAGGTYYMRLSKTGQDPVVTSNFARCGIHVRP
jgi:hypothetical protein